ncbi:hypothetical protein JCM5296_001808 [Sporobolomyces johnsonii]
MFGLNDPHTAHRPRRISRGHLLRASFAASPAPLPGLLFNSSAAAMKRKSPSGSAHPASRPRRASDPLPLQPSHAASALPRQSWGIPTGLHPLQRTLYSSGTRLPRQADLGASGSSERNEDEGSSASDNVTDSEDSDAWTDDEMPDGAEWCGGLSPDDTRLAQLSNSFFRSLKCGPFSTEPEQDYYAFAEVHSSALDKSKKLIDFTAVEVPEAMLGKIDEMQQRIQKSLGVLELEKDKLVGHEAQARQSAFPSEQERADQLIAHMAALSREIVKNRQATKAELQAIRAETTAKLTSLAEKYEIDAQKVQQKLKQVSKSSSLVKGTGGGAGGGGKRRKKH